MVGRHLGISPISANVDLIIKQGLVKIFRLYIFFRPCLDKFSLADINQCLFFVKRPIALNFVRKSLRIIIYCINMAHNTTQYLNLQWISKWLSKSAVQYYPQIPN